VADDDWCFPRRRREVTGGDGGLDGRQRVRKTARKSGAQLSFDVPEREKEKRGFAGSGGASPCGYRRESAAVCMVSGERFQQPSGTDSRGEGRRRERG
jgi:hypothetical protein